jgi:hypothetical protein
MFYNSDTHTRRVDLSGGDTDVSISGTRTGTTPCSHDWFSGKTHIPFGQIEYLKAETHCAIWYFPFDLFKNLTTFRVTSWGEQFVEGFWRPLFPHPRAEIRCPSLREIQCTSWVRPGPLVRSLVGQARGWERAGHRLGLVCVFDVQGLDRDLDEGLRKHVGELRVKLREDGV